MVTTMRLTLALASTLADARCHNEKARRSSLVAERQAMVSQSDKRPARVLKHSRRSSLQRIRVKRTQLKRTRLLSLRSPDKSRHGAGNERSPIRQASSSY